MGSGRITKNQINLDLIDIFQFYLKIYDLRRHSHLCTDVCMFDHNYNYT